MLKVVDSTQYHLWTDALHGRALARQAKNDWDRGTYVRWTVNSAWSAFEMVCGDVLSASGLGNRFKDKFDGALQANGIAAVDWSQGFWQQVMQVYGVRKEFTHVQPTIAQRRLLAPVVEAERAIDMMRKAIKELCKLANHPSPPWVEDDGDRGWDTGGTGGAHATLTKFGADPDGADTIRIAYVIRGKEHVCDVCPPGTDHRPLLDDLVKRMNAPAAIFRAYRGKDLIEQRELPVRGA